MKHLRFFAVALGMPLAFIVAGAAAHACTIDSKATALANGHLAGRTRVKLTVQDWRTWAFFSFPGHYAAHTPIRFAEERVQLVRVLPPEALQRACRWSFGDGTHADGWTVAHRYARAGTYRISVTAYYPSYGQYYEFDNVRIIVTR